MMSQQDNSMGNRGKSKELVSNTYILEQKAHADAIEYAEYLRDKRVVLVGPSTSIQGRNLGKEIEGYDVVVRLNKALHMRGNFKDYGRRIDVLYNNMCYYEHGNSLRVKELEKQNVKYLVSAYPAIPPFFKKDIVSYLIYAKGRFPVVIPPIEPYYALCGGLNGSRPYTGMCAIMDLMRYPIKSLDVFGVDFYLTGGYHRTYKNIKSATTSSENSIHSASKHLEFLRRNLYMFNKLTYDPLFIQRLFSLESNWTKFVQDNMNKYEFWTNKEPKLTSEVIWLTVNNNGNSYNSKFKYGELWTFWDGFKPLYFNHTQSIQVVCPYATGYERLWSVGNKDHGISPHILWLIESKNPWNRPLNYIEKLIVILLNMSKKGQIHICKKEVENSSWIVFLHLIKWIKII